MTIAAKLRNQAKATAGAPHLIVNALAGTGKTTTLTQGLKYVMGEKTTIDPSPQQKAVWDCLAESRGKLSTACFVAFNKSIASELQTKVSSNCNAMTLHSLGIKACIGTFGPKGVRQDRTARILAQILCMSFDDLKRKEFKLMTGVEKLVGYCKKNLANVDADGEHLDQWSNQWQGILEDLISYYDLDLNGNQGRVMQLVPEVLMKSKEVYSETGIDYDDMIWLPVTLGLPVRTYDMLLVDESQDLNRSQQALALRAGRRLVFCGDPRQAIYGFAGADSQSMDRMRGILATTPAGCVVLPLTVTRRCGKAIVEEAKKIVPEFEAHESNGDGSVVKYSIKPVTKVAFDWTSKVEDADMIVCRCTAPLVSTCFKFVGMGRKAVVQGRDMGKNLATTVKKLRAKDVVHLLEVVENWVEAETQKEATRKVPNENRLIAIQDKADCIRVLSEGAGDVEEVLDRIDNVFSAGTECRLCLRKGEENQDECPKCRVPLVPVQGIKLSTIHKAKGLEANRVFLIEPPGATVPHPAARTAWQKEQEWNLRYVAITRAIKELVYVS